MLSALKQYGMLLGLFLGLSVVIGGHYAVYGLRRLPADPQWGVPVARAERGPALIRSYGCGSCHTVPGVPGAEGKVGPRLDRVREQVYLAGVLPNSPPGMVEWIRHPRRVNPRTAMPDLGVGEEDARDIAAYLYTLP